MLRGFSASYAGHIVDDHLGFQGTPANDRWYPNEKLAEAFDWAVDFAQLLDQLGYDEFWMADILTQGRVIFGVGRGYHTREVETFGAPMLDSNANRELFEEQIEVVLKAFNEDAFSHDGTYYHLPARVPWPPAHQPGGRHGHAAGSV
jgi:alkanesulfonate monooxygenase SsuD/methylene tetrahydromethanopterin reductase-like flavin-dependent oxidoreductase (luciferase family)